MYMMNQIQKVSATIVCPTLDLEAAAKACRQAQDLAGVPTAVVLVADLDRRGGVIPSNAAFTGALRLATPYIAYLNDDAQVTQQNWLKRLIEVLQSDPTYGIAAPSGPCRTPPQNKGKPGMPPNVVVVSKPLVWFCAAIRRELFTDLGLFDERFIHYGDETDFTRRAFEAGWKNVWVQDVWVDHEGSGEWIQPWRSHDVGEFRKKWRK